jgi:hypothetical protein
MKFNTLSTTIFATVAATATVIGMTGQQANAGSLTGGWNYAIDSFHDGVTDGHVNQGAFEFYGMAIKEDYQNIYVALNTNLGLNGKAYRNAGNGLIGYGDLLFNFTGNNLVTANNQKSLFAIRFDGMNDASVGSTGVYSNVQAKSVTGSNSGFSNLNSGNLNHQDYVNSRGGSASMGDLAQNDAYFGNSTVNVIKSGTKVGDIKYLTVNDLSELNLNFGQFGAIGSQTIGFSFDRSLLPTGDYLAHLLAECANDGMAIRGQFTGSQGVPEPITGLVLAAGLGGAAMRKMKKSQKSA